MSSLNPNPKSSSAILPKPSSSNPPNNPSQTKGKKKKSNRNRNRNRSRRNKKKPNWLELPEDVWFKILSNLKTIDIIENVQKVCMLFRKICTQPSMFKTIDMYLPGAFMELPYDVNKMTCYAVDRSAGGLVDIYLEFLCDDDTLMYIVERSKNLKHLRLGHYIHVSDEGLIKAVQKVPMLEELQLLICEFSEETVEAVGRICTSLRSFSLTQVGSRNRKFVYNGDVQAIAKSMPQLRHLQLIGNSMTNEGLKAIFDGCPLLESLDLRACFHIDLSGDLGKRCAGIKHLRRPNDSTADYGRQASVEEDHMYYRMREQEGEYDSDDSYMFGFYEDFDYDDFTDKFADYYDDEDFPFGFDYFGLGSFLDFDS